MGWRFAEEVNHTLHAFVVTSVKTPEGVQATVGVAVVLSEHRFDLRKLIKTTQGQSEQLKPP